MTLKTQAIRFLVSGGISAVIDLGLTWIMQIFFGAGPILGRSVGFIFGTITAYLINRRWTFQAAPSYRRFFMVAGLYTMTYFINVGLHAFCYDLFIGWGWGSSVAVLVAYLIAQTVGTVINFVVQRVFIFKKSAE
ncbi:GtrA family protein [Corynebacterium alimapuense]|uniref:GtrA family protein n=1 Tax=Corynebacterium alimapuense TaxID=1576874 RepID=A0A3M8K4Z7_9CORY|nr:GtrA family protein [Corynebacterium alimapuense]RNE48281.1 GtrA family protein [Corynebacterium alimapuense]